MAKFRTGTRNLLAATPTLLLLAFASLSFIPLFQAPESIATTFEKTQLVLQQSDDVRKLLSAQREIYWPFVHSSTDLGFLKGDGVSKMSLYAINARLKNIQRIQRTVTDPIEVRYIDFGNEGDDQVTVTLVCRGEYHVFSFDIDSRQMVTTLS
eukprot:GHVS01059663.1.p1 GENE.GHVS01059663.1~~GHVS01059663.1.p1  ORF type:complete len:153 (-),score=11.03 GHVS01059663.1:1078-1536(-)